MAEEINKTYTSNSLYNDSTGVIAFAEQLKQELINWANYQHVTEELGQNRPNLQNELNNLFLSVYERFLTFLNDADASEEAINTWKEIENFLADYTDEKTLASIVAELNNKIESRLTVPLESTTGSSITSTMTQKAITETINESKTFTTGEKVDNIGIDDKPVAGSENLVKSGGVFQIQKEVDDMNYEDKEVVLSSNSYINTNWQSTTPAKVSPGISSYPGSGIYCTQFNVLEGQNFRIFGKGTSGSTLLYAFVDDSNIRLDCASNNMNYRNNGIIVTAPENAVRLVINFSEYNSSTDKIQYELPIQSRVKSLEDNQVQVVDSLNSESPESALSAKQGKVLGEEIYGTSSWVEQQIVWHQGHYYNGNNNPLYGDAGYDILENCYCKRIAVTPGEKYHIYGYAGGSTVCFYIVTDNTNTQISGYKYTIVGTYRTTPVEVTIPDNGAYMYINLANYQSGDRVEKIIHTNGLEDRVTILEEKIDPTPYQIKPLRNKNIVVFGDSISAHKYQNKTWCDYASEISGANFITLAVGGTQLRQRHALIELFDPTHTYTQNTRVFYKESDTMNCYKCTVATHTGAWDDNDFELVNNGTGYDSLVYSPLDIINLVIAVCNTSVADVDVRYRNQAAAMECIFDHETGDDGGWVDKLKSTDFSAVDAIVILAGTNDFLQVGEYGTPLSGSIDKNKTYGAINEIVRLLNSTFKSIPIYFCSPMVRWMNYSGGIGTDANWGDVYIPSGGTLTYKKFVESLLDEFGINHIPCCNAYKEMNWNKWNFSNYYTSNDGTHPYKGFRNIAEKIVSFLISNKNFN